MAVLLTTLALSGCSAGSSSFLRPGGPVAGDQRQLFFEIISLMAIVVIPIFVLVPMFAWRYRRRNTRSAYRPRWDFWLPLEFFIWGIPIAIVAGMAVLVWGREVGLDPYATLGSDPRPLEVEVVGLDWKWLFIYPEQGIATVGQMAFPADRPVHFRLTSDSVMLSFFIPALGSQIYAMAGMVTQLHLQATGPGTFDGENTQFNGSGFQDQHFSALALSDDDFTSWVQTVQRSGKPLDGAAYEILARKSATTAVRAELGGAGMPPDAVFFSPVDNRLFDRVVAKYGMPSPSMGGSTDMTDKDMPEMTGDARQ